MSLKPWEWGLIGMAIGIVIIINMIILWVLVTRRRKLQKENAESETINEIESTSSRLEDEGTIITTITAQEIKTEDPEMYAFITTAQTGLYPPPPSKQHQLGTLPENTPPLPTASSLVSERFLSLSPFRPYKTQSPQSVSTESPPSTLDSRQASSTPLKGSLNGPAWRGPTPPWTQYPGRNRP
ncbi:hypothetical protein K501DRAFT_289195 [Backusella circina FSU 941]|nr:hypothetical protein K501DRAFT_289195 [Backusella circina FSU 941]